MDDKRAIEAALDSRWQDALKLNRQIIRLDPVNIDALNRQARAYLELGKYHLAKKYYLEVLKIDSYNSIALKNLKILKASKINGKIRSGANGRLSPTLFLQEPGKTKVVVLLKVAEPQKLSQTFCGMEVKMVNKNHKMVIVDGRESYLGVLPDDICHKLIRLLKGGNKYEVFIKAIKVNGLSVLIKETFRSKKFKDQPSFLDSTDFSPTSQILTPLDGEDEGEEELEETEEEGA